MNALALSFAGYSILCALSVALTHFNAEPYREQPQSRAMGLVLLLALCWLQAAHFEQLYRGGDWTGGMAYRMALFAVAPSFFLFSRPLLQPGLRAGTFATGAVHFLPVAAALALPAAGARPLAFAVGAGYLLWVGRSLLPLRGERERFPVEMALLASTFVVAVGVAALGLLPPVLPQDLFTASYASAIGLAFLLVQTSLGRRPQLAGEVREAAQAAQAAGGAYAATTLGKVDCDAVLARLHGLMASERLFVDAELSLAGLAARLGLSAHQLSELLNTRLGKGFARYLRELRVDAAKAMLCDKPAASVLSVGLGVGFSSPSNFYEAFREIEGTTPGQYRKLRLKRMGGADDSTD